MEVKWYMIAMIALIATVIAGESYSDHLKMKCKIAAMEAHMPLADIEKACKQ